MTRRVSLGDAFQRYFELVPASTPELRNEAYAIRFQVYCREMLYEPESAFPDGREHDEFDDQSRHRLLRHKPSGLFAGCVRLVLNRPEPVYSQLPFERNCLNSLDRKIIDPAKLVRETFGEISRLAVLGRFRRRANEHLTPHGVDLDAEPTPVDERRVFPHIALGLYLSAAAIALDEGLEIVFVMMEPRLARHMRRYGIMFMEAGAVIDYHGLRGPFFITRAGLYQHLDPGVRELLDHIREAQDTTEPGSSASP